MKDNFGYLHAFSCIDYNWTSRSLLCIKDSEAAVSYSWSRREGCFIKYKNSVLQIYRPPNSNEALSSPVHSIHFPSSRSCPFLSSLHLSTFPKEWLISDVQKLLHFSGKICPKKKCPQLCSAKGVCHHWIILPSKWKNCMDLDPETGTYFCRSLR